MKPIICRILLCTIYFGFALLFETNAAKAENVDLEIVLSVDASGSVDRHELQLQLDGIAAAFRDPAVLNAIKTGPLQKVAVSLLIWSDAANTKIPSRWFIVKDQASAEKFAKTVKIFRKKLGRFYSLVGGGTGIGDSLAYAINMIETNEHSAPRRVVDISGDGRETLPWSKGAIELSGARILAQKFNVTVNGLAIVTDEPDLMAWYRDNMIIGPGSFVITATSFKDFSRAMRKKLLREFTVLIGEITPVQHNVLLVVP